MIWFFCETKRNLDNIKFRMQVELTQSFFKSLKRLNWHNSPVYKTYNLFFYQIPEFLKNIWRFRKALWNFRWWDYTFTLGMLQTSLKVMSPRFEKFAIEVESSKSSKVKKMNRAIFLLENFLQANFLEQAESELGEIITKDLETEPVPGKPDLVRLLDKETPEEKQHNQKVFERAKELEEEQWEELWRIIRGKQMPNPISKVIKMHQTPDKKVFIEKEEDGSDMRTWWD